MNGFELYISDRFRNRKIDFFNGFTLNLAYDSVASSFGFEYLYNPDNPEHKEFACVSHYHEVQVKFNGELLLSGNMVKQTFSESQVIELAKAGGYSRPGVLEDCEVPIKCYPLQNNGLSLAQIAKKILDAFELEMIVDPAVADRMNKVFDTSTASETQKAKEYLHELAKQKDIIISHDVQGRVIFTEAKTHEKPFYTFDFTKGGPGLGTRFDFDFDGQNIHSHITVQKQASADGGNAGSFTIRNPYVVGGYYRPKIVSQSSGDDVDTELAAQRELRKELEGIQLVITTDSWLVDGKIFFPNSIIEVHAPRLYIWNMTRWFVKSVAYTGNQERTTAVLTCVLPETYNSDPVKNIYASINLHA